MLGLGTTELIIIAVIIMVLFGFKKLPDAARSLGRSARILKAETKGLHDDDEQRSTTSARVQDTPSVPPAPRFDPMTGEPLDGSRGVAAEPVRPADSSDRQP